MSRVDKVTAFITRGGGVHLELCVFDHPAPGGGTQLPAGTVDPGEEPLAAAAREAWEETGLAVELVAEVGRGPASSPGWAVIDRDVVLDGRSFTRGHNAELLDDHAEARLVRTAGVVGRVPSAALCLDSVRHFVHFGVREPVADEWYVVTPDGGGHCWRCHWLSLADARESVHGVQRTWLVDFSDALREACPVDDAAVGVPASLGEVELFLAPPWSGTRTRFAGVPRFDDPAVQALLTVADAAG